MLNWLSPVPEGDCRWSSPSMLTKLPLRSSPGFWQREPKILTPCPNEIGVAFTACELKGVDGVPNSGRDMVDLPKALRWKGVELVMGGKDTLFEGVSGIV